MPPSLPANADQVVISVNPKAGAHSSRARVDALEALLRCQGYEPTTLTDLDAVQDLSSRLFAQHRLRALVVVGGDGTAAELVNRTPPGLPLTLLPAGNENLLARYLGISNSPHDVCRVIADGQLRQLDAGRAGKRIFLLMFGCGFDAEVVHRVHARRTGHIWSGNYFKPILDCMRNYRYPALTVRLEPGPDESQSAVSPLVFRVLFAFNLPCYGGGLRIAPDACGDDGRLDVCGFARGGLGRGLFYAAAVALRQHQRLSDWIAVKAQRLTVSAETPVHYQLDGDPGGDLPVEIEVLPQRLTLLTPAAK